MSGTHRIELLLPLGERDVDARPAPWPATELTLHHWDPALYPGFLRVADQMPRLHGIERGGTVTVDPPLPPGAAALGPGTLALMVTPQGDASLSLSVGVDGDLDAVMGTLQAVRDEAAGHRVLYEGAAPLDALRERVSPAVRERLESCRQTGPVASRHLCIVDPDQIPLLPEAPGAEVERDVADAVDLRAIGRLVYYDALPYAATPIRRAQSGVAFPDLANRYAGTVAAVSPNGSVIVGHAEGLVAGMVLAHVIVQGAKQRAAAVREAAYADLSTLAAVESQVALAGAGAAGLRDSVVELAERAGRHRVALAFGAEAYLDIESVVPSSVIGSYHRALVAAERADEAVRTATLLVDRLDEALGALRAVVVAAERQHDELRSAHLTRVGGILAAIALVLTFVFGVYGANPAPAGPGLPDVSLGYGAFLVAAVALVYVIGAIYRGDWGLWRLAVPAVQRLRARPPAGPE